MSETACKALDVNYGTIRMHAWKIRSVNWHVDVSSGPSGAGMTQKLPLFLRNFLLICATVWGLKRENIYLKREKWEVDVEVADLKKRLHEKDLELESLRDKLMVCNRNRSIMHIFVVFSVLCAIWLVSK